MEWILVVMYVIAMFYISMGIGAALKYGGGIKVLHIIYMVFVIPLATLVLSFLVCQHCAKQSNIKFIRYCKAKMKKTNYSDKHIKFFLFREMLLRQIVMLSIMFKYLPVMSGVVGKIYADVRKRSYKNRRISIFNIFIEKCQNAMIQSYNTFNKYLQFN